MQVLNEREFTKQVIDIAHLHGWRIVHFLPASVGERNRMRTNYLGDGKGYPDIVAVRERILFAELKVGTNKPTVEQQAWEAALRAAGAETHVWVPSDLDVIQSVFARREGY